MMTKAHSAFSPVNSTCREWMTLGYFDSTLNYLVDHYFSEASEQTSPISPDGFLSYLVAQNLNVNSMHGMGVESEVQGEEWRFQMDNV